MEEKELYQILEPWLEELLISQEGGDDVCIWDQKVLVTQSEVTECYYGNCLIQDIIVAMFPIGLIIEWAKDMIDALLGNCEIIPDEVYADIIDEDMMITIDDELDKDLICWDITEYECMI